MSITRDPFSLARSTLLDLDNYSTKENSRYLMLLLTFPFNQLNSPLSRKDQYGRGWGGVEVRWHTVNWSTYV